MSRDTQFGRSLVWSLGGLTVIAVAVISIIVLVPKKPSTEIGSSAQDRPKKAAHDPAPNVDLPPPSTSEGNQHTTFSQVDPPSPGPGKAQPEPTTVDSADRVSPSPPVERTPSESWQVGEVSIEPSVFLFGIGEPPEKQWFMPAPADRRYIIASLSLTWDGRKSRRLTLMTSSSGLPTIRLTDRTNRYLPLGRLTERRNYFAPLSRESIEFASGETKTMDIAFLVPSQVGQVTLVVDGSGNGAFKLEAPSMVTPANLIGIWRRPRSQLHSLRYEDALADGIADSACRTLRIVETPAGFVELQIPCANGRSIPLKEAAANNVLNTRIKSDAGERPCRLRVIDGAKALILYVGENESAAFLYERLQG